MIQNLQLQLEPQGKDAKERETTMMAELEQQRKGR